MEFPLRVESYGLIPDSGGAGQFRGGMGLRRVVTPVGHDCLFNGVGKRFRTQPWGCSEEPPAPAGNSVSPMAPARHVPCRRRPAIRC